jgi:hypothetical protein
LRGVVIMRKSALPLPAVKTCPKCRLINPPEAERCDCGWDFVAARQERSYLPRKSAATTAGIGAGVGVGFGLLYLIVKLVIVLIRVSATP